MKKQRVCRRLFCMLMTFVALLFAAVPAAGQGIYQKESYAESVTAFAMKKHTQATYDTSRASTEAVRTERRSAEALEGLTVCAGGMPFGVKFYTDGVTVVGFCDVECEKGKVNPATLAGLKQKDLILAVNGQMLTGASQLTELIENSGGNSLALHCKRGGGEFDTTLTPVWCPAESRYKTGIWVRDSGAGIGTVTFVIPETGAFAGLGHGICDADTGMLIPIKRGSVSDVTISSVVKGAAGAPGELKGYFNAGKVGSLLGNGTCGVWGVFSELPEELTEPMPIGLHEELQEGEAYILSTLDSNRVERYDVRISNINRDATGPKCFTVTITDPDLLAVSGGIVQGMSGSPIIQNGKLVGAVTHVLINDPTTGYGIFIENMLASVNIPMAKAS